MVTKMVTNNNQPQGYKNLLVLFLVSQHQIKTFLNGKQSINEKMHPF